MSKKLTISIAKDIIEKYKIRIINELMIKICDTVHKIQNLKIKDIHLKQKDSKSKNNDLISRLTKIDSSIYRVYKYNIRIYKI